MKIRLYSDNTLPLNVGTLAAVLNGLSTRVQFTASPERIRIEGALISNPKTYRKLPPRIISEAAEHDYAFIATNIPYDNNHFFDFPDSVGIISFSGWNELTDLPVENGLVYFIAGIIAEEEGIGTTHHENTGCLNDFLWDKQGVDVGMRAAYLCAECRNSYSGDPGVLLDLQRFLNAVASASRQGTDIISSLQVGATRLHTGFDVLLSYSRADAEPVREINALFKQNGIGTWFDEEQIHPGQLWQVELEKQIEEVRSACVFVGENGRGPWQNMEIRALIGELIDRGCSVIPVLLPRAPNVPELPLFLRQMQWVDLRQDYERNLRRLIDAIKAR